MPHCVTHEWVETDAVCPVCAQPFCDACLVEFLGERYCGPCRDRKLREMQGLTLARAPLAGTGRVEIGRWLADGWRIIQPDLGVFALATLLTIILSGCSIYVVLGPMYCGLLMLCYRRMSGIHVEVGNVFDGFNRFGWSLLALLLIVVAVYGATFVAMIPMLLAAFLAPQDGALQIGAAILYYVLAFAAQAFVYGATFFVFPHIAARNVNPIEALGASWHVFRRNMPMFTLAGLVFSLIASLSFLLLCVGALIGIPWMVAASAQAYADHFGVEGVGSA